jgi:hypothetical protein
MGVLLLLMEMGRELLEVSVERLVLVLFLPQPLFQMQGRRGRCGGEIAIIGIVQRTESIDVRLLLLVQEVVGRVGGIEQSRYVLVVVPFVVVVVVVAGEGIVVVGRELPRFVDRRVGS